MTTPENVENIAEPEVAQQNDLESEAGITDPTNEQGENVDTESNASPGSKGTEETPTNSTGPDSTDDHSDDDDEHGEEAGITGFGEDDPDATVGRYANVREAPKQDVQEFSIDELVRSTLVKIDHVFVPPEGLENWEQKYDPDKSLRIFFVAGDSRTGRFSCAVHLGRYLVKSSGDDAQRWHYYLCRSREKETRFITDILPQNDIKEHSIYFIEDVFQANIRLSGAEQYLDIVHRILVEQDAYLILTGQKSKSLDARIQKIETVGYELEPALEKHLDWYNSKQRDRIFISDRVCGELKPARYGEVLQDLHTPVQVNQLCVRISDQQFSIEENADLISLILEIAKEIGQDDRLRVRHRFFEFSENVRLLALLVGLFQGIERPVLEELYIQEARRLREQGLDYQDPRQEGLDDLFLRIGVEEGEKQRLRFIDPFMEQEVVVRQIPNYRHLLWSVMERVTDWIDRFHDPRLWEFRMLLGEAIGRLGQHRPEAMEVLLDQLAMRSDAQVVVVAGYAMRQMCEDEPRNRAYVARVIKNWIDSGDPNLLWAAGAALWRVYSPFALADERSQYGVDDLHELFTSLAIRFDQFNERRQLALIEAIFSEEIPQSDTPTRTLNDLWQALTSLENVRKKVEKQIEEWKASIYVSMLRAILEIAKHHTSAIVALLREWLDRPNEVSLDNEPGKEDVDEDRSSRSSAEDLKRRAVAQYLTRDLFAHNSKADGLIKERHEPLLGLIEPILDAGQGVVDRVLDVVVGWTENEAWHSSIETCLIHAANRVLHGQRERLCRHLAYKWVRTDRPAVRDLAERVLARALLLNGFPSDFPSGGQGVLLVDGGLQGRSSQSAARIGHQLYERLRARIDLRVGVLGSGLVDCATHAVIQDSFELDHATPRLLCPILERLDLDKTPFVLVLIWEEILDLEDALASPWEGRLILIPFFGTQFPDHPLFFHEVQATTEAVIRPIDLLVGRSMGYRLVRRYASDWDALMAVSFPEVRPLAEDRLGKELERLATTLDERASAATSPDHARLITSGVQWLAGRDMERAVSLLEDWMRRDEYWPTLGEAAAVMLLRSYKEWNLRLGENDTQHRPPPEDVLTFAPLLRLGAVLAECESWRGIETLFQLVRNWAVAPHWSERFRLSQRNTANELLSTIYGLPRRWSYRLFKLFQAWEKPLAEIGEDKTISESVRLLQQWLLLRLRLGRGLDAKLATDREYGLIVLDPGQGSSKAILFLAKVAIEVFKELDKKRSDPLQLLLYRLGDARPVAVSEERPSLDLLVPEAHVFAPRLLMPLTERFTHERLRFRLLLGRNPPLDIDDDAETMRPPSFAFAVGKQQGRVPTWPKHWQQNASNTEHVKPEVARLVKLVTPLLIQEPRAYESD